MAELRPGDEFAGYRIEALAGRGGMGLVYRARQRRPDRTVAIKVIAPELAANRDFRARFEQESAVAAQIEHPNVIPVYEVGEEGGLLYISMRYVDGVDLGMLLAREGPLAPARAARLISQVAGALDAAHACGLVHRDVKPGNILISSRDNAYLTDFGLTKRMADTHGLTATGMFVGTVDYIAPEQVLGKRVDARSDIYSLGCVLHQLLTGSVPFPLESDVAKIFAHVHDEPPQLTNVPAPLAAVVRRAMAKDPADRFQSAGDLGRAAVAGAAGRSDYGTERAVAKGAAAIAGPDDETQIGEIAPTQVGLRPPAAGPGAALTPATVVPGAGPGGVPGAGVGPGGLPGAGAGAPPGRRRWPAWAWAVVAAVVLVAGGGAALAIASGLGGSTPTTTPPPPTSSATIPPPTSSTSTSSTPTSSTSSSSSTTPTTSSTTTSSSSSTANLRAILPPATMPPSVNECQQELMFAADGTAGPVQCANGDVNTVLWHYIARDGHTKVLSAGTFATPDQVLAAMCADHSSTFPLEIVAYRLAQAYYNWQFAVDPSSEYPASCPP